MLDKLLQHSAINTNQETNWLQIAVVVLVIIFVIHVLYKLIFQKYFSPTSLDKIILQRLKTNRSEFSDESENQLAWRYLEHVFESWTEVSQDNDDVYKSPRTHRSLKASVRKLKQVVELGPTDKDIIARINELGGVINSNAKRVFSGSKLLLAASVIVWFGMAFFMKDDADSFFIGLLELYWIWIGIALYILSSFSPAFLIDKRIEKVGNYKMNSVFFALLVALVISDSTYYQIIHHDDDTSSLTSNVGCIGLVIFIIVALFAGYFIIFFALLNYIRNFIFYF